MFQSIYETLPRNCKKYLPKPYDLGVAKIKYKNRWRGVICYEYIPGTTMRNFIENPNKHHLIPLIMQKVRTSLLCLWSSGYIHGDFHLDNVLVTPKLDVKLIDFSTSMKVPKLIFKNDVSTHKWFEKHWKRLYDSKIHNPNLAMFDWRTMNSKGIWKHEKEIIKKAMIESASVKKH